MTWREGANTALTSRFVAVGVRPAHWDYWRNSLRDEEWLLVEWPEGESEPTKYHLSTAPVDALIEQLVFVTKMRFRIERDYQDLKKELGLGHYEGRCWRGFHRHATLSIASYGFLMAERLTAGNSEGGKTSSSATSLRFPLIASAVAALRAQRHVTKSITTLRHHLSFHPDAQPWALPMLRINRGSVQFMTQ